MGGRVFGVLPCLASSVPGSVVPRLAAAFAAMTVPVLLVPDDIRRCCCRMTCCCWTLAPLSSCKGSYEGANLGGLDVSRSEPV